MNIKYKYLFIQIKRKEDIWADDSWGSLSIRSQINTPPELRERTLRALGRVSTFPVLNMVGPQETVIKRHHNLRVMKQNPVVNKPLHLSSLQLRKRSPQREMATLQSHTRGHGGAGCNTPSPASHPGQLGTVPRKNSQNKGAFLGSTRMFRGLHEATEIVCKTACGFVFCFQGSRVYCSGQSAQGPGLKHFKNHSVKGWAWGGGGDERLKVSEMNSKLQGTQIFNHVKSMLGLGSQWSHGRRTQYETFWSGW